MFLYLVILTQSLTSNLGALGLVSTFSVKKEHSTLIAFFTKKMMLSIIVLSY